MPHQCTGCGHTFADGSKEMLSGCPECGGNKFQFHPEGEPVPENPEESPSTEEPPEPPETPDSSVAETVGRATTKVRDFVSTRPDAPKDSPDPNAEWPSETGASSSETESPSTAESDGEIIDADARRKQREADDEDHAQASARSDVVSSNELPESERAGDSDDGDVGGLADVEPESEGRVVSEPSGDDPDLTELREQLNDQFESIKIVEPGQYELNLMELYDREEYIIALQENGRYVIQVPEQWMGDEPGDR